MPIRFHPRHAVVRTIYALAAGAAVAAALYPVASSPIPLLAGWDAAGAVLLSLSGWQIAFAGAAETRERAAGEDPGRTAIYALVLLASVVSLIAATLIARGSSSAASDLRVGLCLATVALSWALTHTAFALRYAHLYYRDDTDGPGGLDFVGDAEHEPTYFDFAYFAFTIGMCFQVSDVAVTGRQLRRAVLLHAVLSFGYSTVILAFTLNLMFGRFG